MIIILEGAERTGKTTLAKALENRGFVYFKDIPHIRDGEIKLFNNLEIMNRLDASLNILRALDKNNINVVVDRFHISEKVFNRFYRNDTLTNFKFFDEILSHMNVKLCLLERELNEEYDKEHPILEGPVLEDLLREFKYQFDKSEIKEKFIFDISKVEVNKIADILTASSEKRDSIEYDFYLASPFFNAEQKERMYYVLNTLRTNGYNVYAPIESGVVSEDEDVGFVSYVFNSNVEAIRSSRKVLAITDGKDMGTIWEAGFAYGIGKPVIYFAETLGDNPFNIMLSESGNGIYTNREDLYRAAKENSFTNKAEVLYE